MGCLCACRVTWDFLLWLYLHHLPVTSIVGPEIGYKILMPATNQRTMATCSALPGCCAALASQFHGTSPLRNCSPGLWRGGFSFLGPGAVAAPRSARRLGSRGSIVL